MTAARRDNGFRNHRRPAAIGLGLALIAAALFASRSAAALTEQVVVDPLSGLALTGYDPVAYYVDGKPKLGRGDFEYVFAGAAWRFSNSGNRQAFIDHPEVYMPRFGGYDPVGLARGAPLPGNPMIWLMNAERLYLFYSAEDRDAFALNPPSATVAAERGWETVRKTLAP